MFYVAFFFGCFDRTLTSIDVRLSSRTRVTSRRSTRKRSRRYSNVDISVLFSRKRVEGFTASVAPTLHIKLKISYQICCSAEEINMVLCKPKQGKSVNSGDSQLWSCFVENDNPPNRGMLAGHWADCESQPRMVIFTLALSVMTSCTASTSKKIEKLSRWPTCNVSSIDTFPENSFKNEILIQHIHVKNNRSFPVYHKTSKYIQNPPQLESATFLRMRQIAVQCWWRKRKCQE